MSASPEGTLNANKGAWQPLTCTFVPRTTLIELVLRWKHAPHAFFALLHRVLVKIQAIVLQRDVPGFTRAAMPILYAQGVRAVTVGVNGGSAPPGVPHNQPFIWRDTQSQAELLAMWHPGNNHLLL